MPDMKKPIENPELVEALAALHQENTPQNQGRVLELVLHHAVLLTPAVVTPPPQAQQGGTAAADQKTAIQFQLITTKDGRPFFPPSPTGPSYASSAAPSSSRPCSFALMTMLPCFSAMIRPTASSSTPWG